jgi:hypothetical protein
MYRRPSLPAILILVLFFPLLAACGGGMGGGAASGTGAAAPTNAPVAQRQTAATSAPAAATAAPAVDALVVAPEVVVTEGGEAAEAPAAVADYAPLPNTADDSARTDAGANPVSSDTGVRAPLPTPPLPENIVQPTEAPIVQQQQAAPLKAGEVDDNVDFAEYQQYLGTFYSPPGRSVDISERYILRVMNEQQQPVLDARVRVFDGNQQIFEGLTYAGGETIFFPRAAGVSQNATTLRVLIEKGNSTIEGALARGQDERQTFVLNGAQAQPQPLRLDVLFLLDATGSMGDEITQIQQTIVSIAERIDQFSPRPELRFGLVAYRDHGDEYVTRVYDFTPDVDAFRQLLLSINADGGGDEPEALNDGLHAAIQQVNWAGDAVRLTFLIADAPPQMNAPQDYVYTEEVRTAVAKGIKVYPIAASNTSSDAEYIFRQIAQQTMATFIFLTYQPGQSAGPPGETTTHQVDPNAFTVERLDDLVVQVVQRELARAVGTA